jgi:hypothetical protein
MRVNGLRLVVVTVVVTVVGKTTALVTTTVTGTSCTTEMVVGTAGMVTVTVRIGTQAGSLPILPYEGDIPSRPIMVVGDGWFLVDMSGGRERKMWLVMSRYRPTIRAKMRRFWMRRTTGVYVDGIGVVRLGVEGSMSITASPAMVAFWIATGLKRRDGMDRGRKPEGGDTYRGEQRIGAVSGPLPIL